MNRNELGRVCKLITTAQGRTFAVEDLDLWNDAIGDLNGDLAYDAVRALIRETSDFITPAHVRKRYGQLASARIEQAGHPVAPAGLEPDEFMTWLRSYRAALIGGATADQASAQALAAVGRPADETSQPAQKIDSPFMLPSAEAAMAATGDATGDDVIEGVIVQD